MIARLRFVTRCQFVVWWLFVILFWSIHFSTATGITHPNWDYGKVVCHTVGGIIVLEEYVTHCGRLTWNRCSFRGWQSILHNVLLQMTPILLFGCLWEWGEELERRINIFLLYEYVKSFIKNLPGVKPHKKAMQPRNEGLWVYDMQSPSMK